LQELANRNAGTGNGVAEPRGREGSANVNHNDAKGMGNPNHPDACETDRRDR